MSKDNNTKIVFTVEREDGSTYTQQVLAESISEKDVETARKKLQRQLGSTYYVCPYGWYEA